MFDTHSGITNVRQLAQRASVSIQRHAIGGIADGVSADLKSFLQGIVESARKPVASGVVITPFVCGASE